MTDDPVGLSLEFTLPEVVQLLNAQLGPTLVAATAGAEDREEPLRWARFDNVAEMPSPEQERRLRCAHRLFVLIASMEGAEIARAWFIGCNVHLGEDSPINAIHDGRFHDVAAAARALSSSS